MIETVTLTWPEVMMAAQQGILRQIQNLQKERPDRYGARKDNCWQLHIEGACGELVVAKYLGLYWSGSIGNLKANDVALFQVRTAGSHRNLILHPTDPDDRIFISVVGRAPTYQIQGWIRACDGKLDKWWSDPTGQNRHAFFIPPAELQAIALLKSRATI